MRLIDADALKKAFRTNEGADVLGHSVRKLLKTDAIIDAMPTIDAVEVVRCGNCKFCMTHKAVPHCIKAFAQPEVGLMDFCSHGERRNPNDHP